MYQKMNSANMTTVPEEEQNELWNRTIEIREARFTVEL